MPRLDPAAPPAPLFDGCWRVTLPDPFVPGVTSAFVLEGPGESWLFDAGADTAASGAALEAKLELAGHPRDRIAGVVLSHTHLDHAGGLLRWRPPRIAAHENAVREMRRRTPVSSRGPSALRRMGAPEAEILRLAPNGEPVGGRPFAKLPVEPVLAGESGPVPGDLASWTWLLAEGHAPGHLALFHDPSRSLLAADQFLARWKTPIMISDPEFDAFGAYLGSIDAALALGTETIYASHTIALRPAGRWLRERRAHLEATLERLEAAVRGGARTAWDVVLALYPEAPEGGLRVLFLREQLAMLRHLAFRGVLVRAEADGVERFAPAA
ncbi:MAG: MBL fold metallo-hydrolase [Gemmatimonadota bacterium]